MTRAEHRSLLSDLDEFTRSSDVERVQLRERLLSHLGREFSPGRALPGSDALELLHGPTGLVFHAIPGGSYQMGFSDEDFAEVASVVDLIPAVEATVKRLMVEARPLRSVSVSPFLCTKAALDRDQSLRLFGERYDDGDFFRNDVRELLQPLGFRLPSEAELEWILRDGGRLHFTQDVGTRIDEGKRPIELPSRFGLVDLLDEHFLEDDWHPNYEGAPSDSEPWYGDGEAVLRGGLFVTAMQSREEVMQALAARRQDSPISGYEPAVRLVKSLRAFVG